MHSVVDPQSHTIMKKFILLLASFASVASLACGATSYYVRQHGFWMPPGGEPPDLTANIFSTVNGGDPTGVNPMDGGATDSNVFINVPRRVYVSGGHIEINRLTVSCGEDANNPDVYNTLTISKNATFSTRHFLVIGTSGRDSYFNIRLLSGGTMDVSDSFYLTGTTSNANYSATTTVTQSGGVMNVSAITGLMLTGTVSGAANGTGTYYLEAGTLNVTGGQGISKGLGQGDLFWTGGSLNTVGVDFDLYNEGGNLTPGGDGVIGTMKAYATGLVYEQVSSACLSIDIGTAGAHDFIDWTGGSVSFWADSQISLNLIDNPSLTTGQTFDVMVADSINAENFTLIGDFASQFSVAVVDGNTLRLTYIPEPAAIAWLLGVLALVAMRRRG